MRDPMMECDRNKKKQDDKKGSKKIKICIANGRKLVESEMKNLEAAATSNCLKSKDNFRAENYKNSMTDGKLADFKCKNNSSTPSETIKKDQPQVDSLEADGCGGMIAWVCNFIDLSKDIFNESSRDIICRRLEELEINFGSDGELIALVKALSQLSKTPYFYFLSSSIYSILVKLLNPKVKCQMQIKVLAFDFLSENYDSCTLFKFVMEMYNSVDSTKIGRRSFRNYAAYRLLENIFDETVATNGASKAHEIQSQPNVDISKNPARFDPSFDEHRMHALLGLTEHLNHCIPFAEFLSKNTDDALCCAFMLIYAYSFLGKIKEDLMNIKKTEEIKNVEENAIAKIFLRMNEVLHFYKKHENKKYDCILTILYQSDSLKSIVLTVLKRLLNFFSIKNKRLLSTIKVPMVFSKREKDFLHKNLKDHTLAYTNVFKQLDYKYLLRLLLKIQVSDKNSLFLLENINEDLLDEKEMAQFYDFYMKFVEHWKSPVKAIKIKSIEIFARLFNSKLDKSFARFVAFSPITKYESEEVMEMLAIYFYTVFYVNNRPSSIFNKTVDVIELVSLLTEAPSNLQKPHRVRYYNNILKILYFMGPSLNRGLVGRIFPILRKLTFHSDYSLNAGRLYRRILDLFKFEDRFFEAEFLKTNGFILMAKASVGDPSFEEDYKRDRDKALEFSEMENSQGISATNSNQPDELKNNAGLLQGVMDNSIISYLYYNSSFAAGYRSDLKNILRRNNKSTINLLEYLLHVTGSNEEFSGLFNFISGNIEELCNLCNFQPERGSQAGTTNEQTANNNGLSCNGYRKSFSIQHNPFENLVLGIFLNSLRIKAVLPCMVIPYLIPRMEGGFIYRNYADSCVNCINDAIRLISHRIIGYCERVRRCEGGTDNVIGMRFLKKLFTKENPVSFIYIISSHAPIRKILDKIDYQNDFLFVFIVIWNLRPFPKKEKETFFKHIEENVNEERIFDLVKKSKSFYEKNPKENVPLDFII